ncbi:MAG: hypothetical protein ACR2GP_13655 [Burkholderiaceae bacterium]
MKLYYMQAACSLSVQITLNELGMSHTRVLVDSKTKRLLDGSDYHAINPRGQVPVQRIATASPRDPRCRRRCATRGC